MRIIVPMAGKGKRMRPHTLSTPKPLIPIAGKPIVQRLVEDIVSICHQKVEEVAFIIGDFGAEVEKDLLAIAESQGAKGSIYYQHEPLGTAHAILCAGPSLEGPLVVAFADTLFVADFVLDPVSDGVIWTKVVEDPSAFGVVKKDSEGVITDFVEKPKEFVSDEAIIGIYYFRDGDKLKSELQYLLDNDIKDKGEYQLTNALENMKVQGLRFTSGKVDDWMDCGNKDITVDTNARVLSYLHAKGSPLRATDAVVENSEIIEPCYLGAGAVVRNSKIGPGVSIGNRSTVEDCTLERALIRDDAHLKGLRLTNSMIGSHVRFDGAFTQVSIGDYCSLES